MASTSQRKKSSRVSPHRARSRVFVAARKKFEAPAREAIEHQHYNEALIQWVKAFYALKEKEAELGPPTHKLDRLAYGSLVAILRGIGKDLLLELESGSVDTSYLTVQKADFKAMLDELALNDAGAEHPLSKKDSETVEKLVFG